MIFSPPPKKQFGKQLRISERRLLLIAGDALSIVLSVYIALRIWAFVGDIAFSSDFIMSQLFWFALLSVVWFVLAGASDFYDLQVAASLMASIQRLTIIQLQMLIVYVLVYFLSEPESLPRLFIVYYAVLSFIMILIWRVINPALVGWKAFQRRALIVGTDWAAQEMIQTLHDDRSDAYAVIGVIGEHEPLGHSVGGVAVLGYGVDILSLVKQHRITEVILSSTRDLSGETFQGVMDAYEYGVAITPMPILYERMTGRVPIKSVNDNWTVVLPLGQSNSFKLYPLIKRLLDVCVAVLVLPILLLMLPLVALLLRIDSRGPVFYVQTRVGLNGRAFRMVKLRTMAMDAEAQTGAVFARENDPRITRLGHIMRKLRVDELPQLYNVLKGDMSLVGPRPERPEHVARLEQKIPFYRTRQIVRPGVTGWAQVRYHYGLTDDDAHVKLQYDLYYIRHQSLSLDVNIIVRTVGKVLRMTGV
jgi:exopolysaccharide biosynthesis polyprenyl glycosylphosphotransferase